MLEKPVKKEIVYEDWLEGYNMSITGKEKWMYLERGLQEAESPENLLRKKLWETRFTKNGSITGYDFFMAQWKEIEFQNEQLHSMFGKKRALKALDTIYENLMLSQGTTDALKNVLYQEYVNLAAVYIYLCQNDQNYKSVIFGIGKMREDKLIGKIADNVYRVSCQTFKLANKEKEFELFSRGAKDAFLAAFPECAYIWENVEKDA